MNQITIKDHLDLVEYRHFASKTIVMESRALAQNPLGDSSTRRSPILVPRGTPPSGGWPVVLVLSGFTGNGPNSFNLKTFETNAPLVIDAAVSTGEAPRAIFVFCEAMTFWGGSQFINSEGMGRYEDYVLELCAAVRALPDVSSHRDDWCVAGGSSGGYGALSLASRHPDRFGQVIAIAPDSFFEASLLPEIRTVLPWLKKLGGVSGIKTELASGKFMKRREAHTILNVVAMGICYAPMTSGFALPIDEETGEVLGDVWQKWLAHDPIVFLRERAANVRKVSNFYLDVGRRDQFQLQYGTRQIKNILDECGASVTSTEFDGNHFDIGERRIDSWKWLTTLWRG